MAQDLSDYEKRRNAEIDSLNDSLDAFKDAQDAKTKMIQDQIDDEQALLAEARAQVESDWDAMYADLKAKCEEHGISIEEIIATWDDSLTPLENYLNMLDLIQQKIDEMNESEIDLQYGEQQQSLKENMEKADQKRNKFKNKIKEAEAAGDTEKAAKYQKKYNKWDERYQAYKKQYDTLISSGGKLARSEIELTEKTFEANYQKCGASNANYIQSLLMSNATYADDTHKMIQKTDADWSKSNKQRYASLLDVLSDSVGSYDEALGIVQGDSNEVATAILTIAQDHGIDIENVITSAWNSSISALDNYRAILADVLTMAAQAESIDVSTPNTIYETSGVGSTSTGSYSNSTSVRREELQEKKDNAKEKMDKFEAKLEAGSDDPAKIEKWQQKYKKWKEEYKSAKKELKKLPAYASGLRSATKAHLGLTNEAGREVIVTKNGILTPLQKGDAVLSAAQTKNLFDLAKIDASAILRGLAQQAVNAPQSNVNNVSSLNIDNLVTITGSVTPDMLPLIREEVEKGIKQSWNTINKGIHR